MAKREDPCYAECIKTDRKDKLMRKILIVVDMQNDFITGSLGTKEAQDIVPHVLRKIQDYAVQDIYVTRDTHPEHYLDTNEGRHLPVVHCIEGTWGWELQDAVKAAVEGAVILNKPTFGSTELADLLSRVYENLPASCEGESKLRIELVGLCTDICVVSNALLLKARLPEADICVDKNCCAGVTPLSHEAALTTMKMCQIEVL